MKLQTRIILWTMSAILLATTVTLVLNMIMLVWQSRSSTERNLFEIADTVAGLPEVRSGLRGSPFDGIVDDRVRKISGSLTGVDSVIVCDQQKLYYSNPNVFLLGLVNDDPAADDAVAHGHRYVKTTTSIDGEMIRAYVPVFDGGVQVGFVETAVMAQKLAGEVTRLLLASGIFLLAGLAIGGAGAMRLAGKIKSVLLGLEPEEIAKLYYEHSSMVEAMHEGVIAVNEDGCISMSNESARNLLGAGGGSIKDASVESVMPETRVRAVINSGKPVFDYEQRVKGRVIISNVVPIIDSGKVVGAVETLQDRTQVVRMAEELTGIRQLVEALRSSSHEFSNKMQALLGMLEMEDYDSAKDFILGTQSHHGGLEQQLVHSFKNPMVAGLLLGKFSTAGERGVGFSITEGSSMGPIDDPSVSHELVTILGNLIDNAMDALQKNVGRNGAILLTIADSDGVIAITIEDNGEGIRKNTMDSIFLRGFSTKGEGRGTGLYLVRRAVRLLGGTIEVQSHPGSTVFSVTIPHASGGET